MSEGFLYADLPSDDITNEEKNPKKIVMLSVHKSTVLTDIIEHFSHKPALNDPEVELAFTIINNKGEHEIGAGVGVCRDVIGIFWEKFFDALTVGTQVRIPII